MTHTDQTQAKLSQADQTQADPFQAEPSQADWTDTAVSDAPPPTHHPAIKTFVDIPGWFFWVDRLLFASLLDTQSRSEPGVLVELGTYQGKSAVIIGDFVRPGERFVALDLFGRIDLLDPADPAGGRGGNQAEVNRSYPNLSRTTFERNYLALHDQLPEIVEGLSSSIVDHVAPGTARFIHVDASHLYDQVRIDVSATERLLRPGGVAVFDDWRSEHTPGVGAAVWEAVFTRGLIPIAITPYKFYGVYSDPEPYRFAVQALIAREPDLWSEEQHIAGQPVVRLKLRGRPAAPKPSLNDADLDAVADRLADRLADRVADRLLPRLPAPADSPWRRTTAVVRSARRRPR
ncbi:MAG: class I SAM-dependent methyltransferase [Propionibacteriaceae bacterium]